MRQLILVSGLAILATFLPTFATAEKPSQAFLRIQKQRQLAMVQNGVNSLDALKLSHLGILTYQHRLCGEKIVPAADIEKIWSHYKVEAIVNDSTKNAEVKIYADALEAEFGDDWRDADKRGYCNAVRERLARLRTEYRLK